MNPWGITVRIRSIHAVASAGLVLAAGLLNACSGGDGPAGSAPSAPPAESSDGASEDATEEGVTSEDGGSEVTTYQSVPPGFPAEVPILDESEATGSVTEYDDLTSYSVVMESDGAVDETLQEAATLVSDAGFRGDAEVVPGQDPPLPVVFQREEPALTVVLSGSEVDGGSLLTYTVEVS